MMLAVVAVRYRDLGPDPGVAVAGKTGTAELKTTTGNNPGASQRPPEHRCLVRRLRPAGHPRIVAGALFPNAGFGGSTAAPPARHVIAAALHRGGIS